MNKKRNKLSSEDKNGVQANIEPLEIEVLEGQIDIIEYLQPEQLALTNYNNEIKITHEKSLKRVEQEHIEELNEVEQYLNSKDMNDYFNSAEYKRICEETKRKLKEYGL